MLSINRLCRLARHTYFREDDFGIVFLQIFTNKGTRKHYGGPEDAGSPFSVYIPGGHAVVGFVGSYGQRLHNIGVITLPGLL